MRITTADQRIAERIARGPAKDLDQFLQWHFEDAHEDALNDNHHHELLSVYR